MRGGRGVLGPVWTPQGLAFQISLLKLIRYFQLSPPDASLTLALLRHRARYAARLPDPSLPPSRRHSMCCEHARCSEPGPTPVAVPCCTSWQQSSQKMASRLSFEAWDHERGGWRSAGASSLGRTSRVQRCSAACRMNHEPVSSLLVRQTRAEYENNTRPPISQCP